MATMPIQEQINASDDTRVPGEDPAGVNPTAIPNPDDEAADLVNEGGEQGAQEQDLTPEDGEPRATNDATLDTDEEMDEDEDEVEVEEETPTQAL